MPKPLHQRLRDLAAAALTTALVPLSVPASPPAGSTPHQASLLQPTVMTAFFAWYKFAAKPDGSPDPANCEHFYAYDAFSGARPLAIADDFPIEIPGSPPQPYRAIVDWRNTAWYQLEFADMAAAGIDIALVDAWPHLPLCAYRNSTPNSGWDAGAHAADAVRAMQAAGKPCPRIGMFWEGGPTAGFNLTTGFSASDYSESCSTLSYTKNAWAAWLQVREWFRSLGATNAERAAVWGTLDGRPVIMVYYPDHAQWTQQFWTWLSDQFLAEFGVRPYVILNSNWLTGTDGKAVRMDAAATWDSAITGPRDLSAVYGGDNIVSVGPGYDSTVQPMRWMDPIRLREDGIRGDPNETGNFYDYSWQHALAMSPKAIFIETWDERHEGTSIARSTDYGDAYIRQTARYTEAFHSGTPVPITTVLNHPSSIRKRIDEGSELAGRTILRYTAANDSSLLGNPVPWRLTSTTTPTDGGLFIERSDNDGRVRYAYPYLYTAYGVVNTYLHVQVADGWGFDIPDYNPAKIRMTYIDDRSVQAGDPAGTNADIFMEFDSWDPTPNPGDAHAPYLWGNPTKIVQPPDGAQPTTVRNEAGDIIYQTVWGVVPLKGTAAAPEVKTVEWTAMRPRFGNRQNTGADFRIAVRVPARTTTTPMRILKVEVEFPGGGDFSRYTMADALRALRIATGERVAEQQDQQRLNLNQRPGSEDVLTVADATVLLRKAMGMEHNP